MTITLDGTAGITAPSASLTTALGVTSGGTGATSLSSLSVGTATNIAGGGAGQVPYQTGSGATSFLSAGTSGQVLTSGGSGAPSWTTPSAGAMTLISTINLSGTTVAFTGLSGYSFYRMIGNNISYSIGSSEDIFLQIGTGSPATYVTSGYSSQRVTGSTSTVSSNFANATYIGLYISNWSSGYYISFVADIQFGANRVFSNSTFAGQNYTNFSNSFYPTSSTITAIRTQGDVGPYSFASGTISLYGISS